MVAARDILFIGSVMFTVAVFLFIVNFTGKTLTTSLIQIPQINTSESVSQTFQGLDTTVNRFDYLFFGVFIALVLAAIVTAFLIGPQPVFIIVYLIVTVIGVLLAMVMSNIWEDATSVAAFGTTLNSFPITNHLMTFLPLYVAGVGIVGFVMLFSRPIIIGNKYQGL